MAEDDTMDPRQRNVAALMAIACVLAGTHDDSGLHAEEEDMDPFIFAKALTLKEFSELPADERARFRHTALRISWAIEAAREAGHPDGKWPEGKSNG